MNPKQTPHATEIGYVTKSNRYLFSLEGLPSARINSIISSSAGHSAIVTRLIDTDIQALMLTGKTPLPGTAFSLSSDSIQLPVGEHLLGRVINPLGNSLDDKPMQSSDGVMRAVTIDATAPGINKRHVIDAQFTTGISTIDSLLPIGLGQRQLLIGEPRSGKTSFLYDVIANQHEHDVICIYCGIGKSDKDIKGFASNIEKSGTHTYTVIVAAPSSSPAPMITMAPYTALTIAEYFRDQGKHVLLVLDDMGTHAKYVREIALLAEQVPGRDSYPGSIFHSHARIVERAGYFTLNPKKLSSITLIPVIEVIPEALTSYITTNLMSMTDGHMLFSAELVAGGQYPAVDISKSVTRVGRQTQPPLLRTLSDRIRALLSRYEEVRTYSRFGTELTGDTVTILKQSEQITELLRQEDHKYRSLATQVLYLSLPFTEILHQRDVAFIKKNKHKILHAFETTDAFKNIAAQIETLHFDQLIKLMNTDKNTILTLCQ